MVIVPISLKTANDFVAAHHRHHRPVRGCKFCIGLSSEDKIIGVAIAGRPVSRHLDNGITLEVTRCCTDGTLNACSKLYSAVRRAAAAIGYKKVITYTLQSEPGTSLRAAGWDCAGAAGGGSWSVPSRPRDDKHPIEAKRRWEVSL